MSRKTTASETPTRITRLTSTVRGAGTVGSQRYDLYVRNIAQEKPTAAKTVSANYPTSKAVDGNSSGISGKYNFYHAAGDDLNGGGKSITPIPRQTVYGIMAAWPSLRLAR